MANGAFHWQASRVEAHLPSLATLNAGSRLYTLRWHVFLSHRWPTGQQQVAMIRERLASHLPGCTCFLDVYDLDDVSKLEEYVQASAVVLIFISNKYFQSINILREVRAAKVAAKPLIVVYEPDDDKGGGLASSLMADCPDDVRAYLNEAPMIRWSILPDFRAVSLALVAERLLLLLASTYVWQSRRGARNTLRPWGCGVASRKDHSSSCQVSTPRSDVSAGRSTEATVGTPRSERASGRSTDTTINTPRSERASGEVSTSACTWARNAASSPVAEVLVEYVCRGQFRSAAPTAAPAADGPGARLILPGSIATKTFQRSRPLTIYTSPLNPGAKAAITSLIQTAKLAGHVRVSARISSLEYQVLRKVKSSHSSRAANPRTPYSYGHAPPPTSREKSGKDRVRGFGHLTGLQDNERTQEAAAIVQDHWRRYTTAPAAGERMVVVLLKKNMWAGEHQRGMRLARQIATLLVGKIPVVLVHDAASCKFCDVLDTAPKVLQRSGLYRTIAIQMLPGRFEAVSAAYFAKTIGAHKTRAQKRALQWLLRACVYPLVPRGVARWMGSGVSRAGAKQRQSSLAASVGARHSFSSAHEEDSEAPMSGPRKIYKSLVAFALERKQSAFSDTEDYARPVSVAVPSP